MSDPSWLGEKGDLSQRLIAGAGALGVAGLVASDGPIAESMRAAGEVLFEKELEIDRLCGRILELELLLVTAGIPVPLDNGDAGAHLHRAMAHAVDMADWYLRGLEDLEGVTLAIENARRAMNPVCREGDHR